MNLRIGLILGILLVAFSAAAMIGFDPEPARKAVDFRSRLSADELLDLKPRPDPDAYLFGFDPRASPVEDARQYISFLDYLSKATGLRFELRFIPRNGSIVDDLGLGRIQFAAVGAGTFINARRKYGVIPLARGVNGAGKATYRAVIVVPPGSPIRDVPGLKGKRFAFGNFNSTQGHLIPRAILAEHGIRLQDFAFVEYTGSHRNCANAVAAGRFDAGGMQDTLAEELERAGYLRIICRSRPYPSSGVAAFRGVSPEALRKVTQALLDFQPRGRDARGLYRWDATEMPRGFTRAEPDDYRDLEACAVRLGLLGRDTR